MKIRSGFISNSSSSCFILDKRDPHVVDYIKKLEGSVQQDGGYGRGTAFAVGQKAKDYANMLIEGDRWGVTDYLGRWINKWYDKLGDNLVFIRESDEGMGGVLPAWCFEKTGYMGSSTIPQELILDEMEYH